MTSWCAHHVIGLKKSNKKNIKVQNFGKILRYQYGIIYIAEITHLPFVKQRNFNLSTLLSVPLYQVVHRIQHDYSEAKYNKLMQ